MTQRKRAWSELSADEQNHMHELNSQLDRIGDRNDEDAILDRQEIEYEIAVTYLD